MQNIHLNNMKIKKFQYGGEPAVSTYVYKKPILPKIQKTRQHQYAEFRPDNRSSWEKQQGQARAQQEYARYQKAQQDQKAQESFDKLMHATLPSTYIESITGQNFGPVGRFVIDMATPGAIGGAGKVLRTAGRGVSKGLKRTLTSIKTEGGFPVSTPYTGKRFGKVTAWVPTNRSPFKGISYLSTGKPEPEGVPINYIRSKVSGDARKLYDVGIRQAQESGNKGLVVGRYLESAPKSLRTYDHYYPDRVHLDNGGTYTNYGMVEGPNKTVFSLDDFYKEHNAGNRVSLPGAPRYRLETPSNQGQKVQASKQLRTVGETFKSEGDLAEQLETALNRLALKDPERALTDPFSPVRPVKTQASNLAQNFLNSTVFPRLQRNRPWMQNVGQNFDFGNIYRFPERVFAKAKDPSEGFFQTQTGRIVTKDYSRKFSMDDIDTHELRHRADQQYPYTEHESKVTRDAFEGFEEARPEEYSADYDMFEEVPTTLSDTRKMIFERRNKDLYYVGNQQYFSPTPWYKRGLKEQDNILKNISQDEIVESIRESNGYGRRFIEYLEDTNQLTPERIEKLRKALIVGSAATPFIFKYEEK